MTSPIPPAAGVPFDALAGQLLAHPWRDGVEAHPIAPPLRIASHAAAVQAAVVDHGEDLASGRLVLLHEPLGNPEWEGSLRLVSFCRAWASPADLEDDTFPGIVWTWVSGALEAHRAAHLALAGTVTTVGSRGFGRRAEDPPVAEVELRASWTPVLQPDEGIERHLAAWQDLLCWAAGTPELPEGVVPLGTRMGRGR